MNSNNTSQPPPPWLDRLLERFCANEFLEIVQGDLHEMYHRNVQEKGKFRARLCYLGDVLDLFRPFALGLNLPHFHITTTGMYRNYLTTAFRNFKRQFGFSLINIFGLSIGIAAFMIILTYVSYELSYDDYLQHKKQLFRWEFSLDDPGVKLDKKMAKLMPAFTHLIRENMPEVKQVARLHHCARSAPYTTISHIDAENNKTSFNEEYAFFADTAFLTLFDIRMLAGDTSALHEPNMVILSESTAERYFGAVSDDIIGQTLQIPNRSEIKTQYKITGIFQDLPSNSHLRADMLMSYRTLSEQIPHLFEDHWTYFVAYTYIQLHPHITEEQFRQKKSQYVELANERAESAGSNPWGEKLILDFDLLRVDEIYLQSDVPDGIRPSGNAQTVYFLFIIGLLVIIIAWVNYVNLTTARAVQRAKEVGVRKVAGASRGQLILQFLSEAFVMNLLAALISLLILWLSLPFFQELTGKPLTFHLWWEGLPNMPLFFGVLGLLFVFSTLLSGFYPALVLSSFTPLKTLRGRLMLSPSRGISLRSGLVVIQFTMSVILIAGTYLMYQQMTYMQNKPLGFDTEQMLVIQSPTDKTLKADAFDVFKNDLLRQVFVEDITASSTVPGRPIFWGWGIDDDKDQQSGTGTNMISVDHEFLDAYDFTIVAGRTFSKDYGTDKNAVILNETLVGRLGFENAEAALHEKIWLTHHTREKEVIGVAKDYHQSSLKAAYHPICFLLEGSTYGKENENDFKDQDRAYLSLKINTSHLKQNIEWIEEKYHSYFPGFLFEYFFLDEHFNQQYKADIQFGKIFGIFASLAIFIACLGILGLSSYMAVQKSKEIGIRKVLGATVANIVLLLSSKFVKLVLIASLIALPLAYFVFDRWLENYAFRIDIGWWFFVIPALVVFLIAIITISVQTVKAALANPVDSLKYE